MLRHHRVVDAGAAEQAAVDQRMQGLDPAVHHFREAGDLGHVLHRQAGVADGLGGAAGGKQLDAARGQRACQFEQVRFIGNGQQCPADGQQVGSHGEGALEAERADIVGGDAEARADGAGAPCPDRRDKVGCAGSAGDLQKSHRVDLRTEGTFPDLLRPGVRGLHRTGVTANAVTVAAAVVSVLVAAAVWRWAPSHRWLYPGLPAWMFLRMAFNAIDGMLAREFGQQSRLGAYLNELCDVVADAALYLSLLSVPGVHPQVLWLLAWIAALSEYAGVLGPMVGASRRYDGPMGKSDRAFVVGVLGLLLALGWIGGVGVGAVASGMVLLCVITRRAVCGRASRNRPGRHAARPAEPLQTEIACGKRRKRNSTASTKVPLFYRYWPATTGNAPPRAIVLLHRGHEHSGRVAHLVDELDLPDTAFFARTRVATAARRGRGETRPDSRRWYATWTASLHTSAASTESPWKTSSWSRRAWARWWRRPGSMTTRRACARWCWRRRPSR